MPTVDIHFGRPPTTPTHKAKRHFTTVKLKFLKNKSPEKMKLIQCKRQRDSEDDTRARHQGWDFVWAADDTTGRRPRTPDCHLVTFIVVVACMVAGMFHTEHRFGAMNCSV